MIRQPHPHQVEAVAKLRLACLSAEDVEALGERFRPVAAFPRYMVGDRGTVFSGVRSCRFLRQTVSPQGYPYVSLMGPEPRPTKCLVHRLVADAFLANPRGLPVVNHVNGVKADARASNLEWCSYGANNDHARREGLSLAHGETHYLAKLSDRDVADIRRRASSGELHREIAHRYGIVRQHVTAIAGGKKRLGVA